jgi:hypothetical protein
LKQNKKNIFDEKEYGEEFKQKDIVQEYEKYANAGARRMEAYAKRKERGPSISTSSGAAAGAVIGGTLGTLGGGLGAAAGASLGAAGGAAAGQFIKKKAEGRWGTEGVERARTFVKQSTSAALAGAVGAAAGTLTMGPFGFVLGAAAGGVGGWKGYGQKNKAVAKKIRDESKGDSKEKKLSKIMEEFVEPPETPAAPPAGAGGGAGGGGGAVS